MTTQQLETLTAFQNAAVECIREREDGDAYQELNRITADFLSEHDLEDNYYGEKGYLFFQGAVVFDIESIYVETNGLVYVHVSGEPFEADVVLINMSKANIDHVINLIINRYIANCEKANN